MKPKAKSFRRIFHEVVTVNSFYIHEKTYPTMVFMPPLLKTKKKRGLFLPKHVVVVDWIDFLDFDICIL